MNCFTQGRDGVGRKYQRSKKIITEEFIQHFLGPLPLLYEDILVRLPESYYSEAILASKHSSLDTKKSLLCVYTSSDGSRLYH